MREEAIQLAGQRAIAVGEREGARILVVILHGFLMEPADLSPFARSLGLPAWYLFPEGPIEASRGRSFWHVDPERRAAALAAGPRDLAAEHPPGREEARTQLAAFLSEASAAAPGLPLVLIGFSQGGMLACDLILHAGEGGLALPPIAALLLLSASRVAFDEWAPRLHRVHGLPVLISHGRADADLAFAAGEALRDALIMGGADITWLPFDGGHEIPLLVWRHIRKLLMRLANPG
jgi:phospholipase/carboxylesterase